MQVWGARRAARATLLVVLVLVATGLSVAAPAAGPSAASSAPAPAAGRVATRPNVVVFLTDDMRADEMRFLPRTARLLAEKGVTFTNAISPHPMCCPARASLVTGQYGQNNGVRHNKGRWGGFKRLRGLDANLGHWLQRAGYRTSYHGKFLNGYERTGRRREPAGWTFWDAQVSGIYSYRRGRFFNGDRVRNEYVTTTMTRRAGNTISRFAKGRAPFFVLVNHVAPHGVLGRPHRPLFQRKYRTTYRHLRPPSFAKPSFNERRVGDLPASLRRKRLHRQRVQKLSQARARALRSVDDSIAATVRRLDRLGELDRTYLVLTSDNGFMLGEHRLVRKNALFDEALDVPLVIRGPGFAPGTVDDTPVTLIDLVATVVDWAGARPTRRLDGVSIERLRDPGRPAVRDTILVQTGDERADRTPGWDFRGVTTDRYLFGIRPGRPGAGILFDRVEDPFALRNRFRDRAYRVIRQRLTRRTHVLSRCAGRSECNRVFGPLPEPLP